MQLLQQAVHLVAEGLGRDRAGRDIEVRANHQEAGIDAGQPGGIGAFDICHLAGGAHRAKGDESGVQSFQGLYLFGAERLAR
ncbi:hypothetical protein D3C76_703310 [compost metagenome]